MYFVKANSLLSRFDEVDIKHVPRIKNQEANDLVQIASKYIVSGEFDFNQSFLLKFVKVKTDGVRIGSIKNI